MGTRSRAPGRVNLIGDHTDYVGGLVLPVAIGLGTEVSGDRGGNWVMLGSAGFDGVAEIPRDGGIEPAKVDPPWARYVAAVVSELHPADGFVGMINSSVPTGSGLASSAALEVAVAAAQPDQALRIDCRSLTVEPVPFPDDAEIVVVDSGEPRQLANSAYAERRA